MNNALLALARTLLAVTMATIAAGGCAVKPPAAPTPVTLKIIGFNDFHGNLQSPGTFGVNTLAPATQRPAVGGAEYLAAYVDRLKAQNPLNVVVASGDLIGASPLTSALFFDEPTVEVLNHVGVEFTSVGNHEFDKGPAELKRLQDGGCRLTDGKPDPNSCRGLGSRAPGTFDGARFKWLAANVIESATGHTLLPAYAVKSFDGMPVAFIGMTLKGTPGIVTPTGVAGLQFRDEADTVNALVPELRAQGVAAIVVLVHQGGVQSGSSVGDINGCDGNLKNVDGSPSEIENIVSRLDDAVDLVISAHTHAAYNCSAGTVDVKTVDGVTRSTSRPTGLANRVGRLVPVTSANAFGRVLTDIDVTIDRRSRHVSAVAPTNRLVDRTDPAINQAIVAAPTVRDIVLGYDRLVAPLANAVIGTISAALPTTPDAAGEQPAGRLIADAQLMATQPAALGGAQIAFMNPGGVRAPGFMWPAATYPHAVTYGDAFAVQPFGNSLVTMTLTGVQLKALLEQQFMGCAAQVAQRVMQVSDGLRYTWRASAPACMKIVDVTFTPTDAASTPPAVTGPPQIVVSNGVVQDAARTWRVTVNNYMAAGGDGFTTLSVGTHWSGGAQDVDALVAWFARYKAPHAAYDPRLAAPGYPRITRLP